MCQALHVHVLPFFRLYRGPEGRLCSFSCTNATIKKFKDALAKYNENRLNVGPAKGLDESEILKLASIGELPADFALAAAKEKKVGNLIIGNVDLHASGSKTAHMMDPEEETAIL
uniref:Uncharacterized protein n=1 Tax=Rhizophora mucronata TaxID=61149 RepID=A0A2P2IZ15_RHIMU